MPVECVGEGGKDKDDQGEQRCAGKGNTEADHQEDRHSEAAKGKNIRGVHERNMRDER